MIEAFVDRHPEVLAVKGEGDADALRRVRKRIRRAALRAVLEEEADLQRGQRTTAQLEARIQELKRPSNVFVMMQERIAVARSRHTSTEEEYTNEEVDRTLESLSAAAFHDIAEEHGVELDPEAEDDSGNESGPTEDATVTVSNDEDEESRPPNWEESIQAFGDIMFAPTIGSTMPGELLCQVCAGDPTVSEEKKRHDYQAPSRLQRHLDSEFHTPWKAFLRKVHEDLKQGDVECPYGCKRKFTTAQGLVLHIEADYDPTWGRHHDDRKREAGWYDEGFKLSREPRKRPRRSSHGAGGEDEYASMEELTERKAARTADGKLAPGVYFGPRESDPYKLSELPQAFFASSRPNYLDGPLMQSFLLPPGAPRPNYLEGEAVQRMLLPPGEKARYFVPVDSDEE